MGTRMRRRAVRSGLIGAVAALVVGGMPSAAAVPASDGANTGQATQFRAAADNEPIEVAQKATEAPAGAACPVPEVNERCAQWTASGDGTDLRAMEVSPKGDRVFTAGGPGITCYRGYYCYYESTQSGRIVARDATAGKKLWDAKLPGVSSKSIAVVALAVSPDGKRVYAVGDDVAKKTLHATQDRDVIVAAYSAANGKRLWRKVLRLPAIDENDRYVSFESAAAIAASPDGRTVYITGLTYLYDRIQPWHPTGTGHYGNKVTLDDALLVGYDAATGKQRWVIQCCERYDIYRGQFLEVSRDSKRVYIGGWYQVCSDTRICPPDYLALAFQAPGRPGEKPTKVWERKYDGFGGFDVAGSMELSRDGKALYLTGSIKGQDGDSDTDWATVAYRARDGKQMWDDRRDLPGDYPHEALPPERLSPVVTAQDGHAITTSPNGKTVFVTGAMSSYGVDSGLLGAAGVDRTYSTIAYHAKTGAVAWEAREKAASGNDLSYSASGITTSRNGRYVYVASAKARGLVGSLATYAAGREVEEMAVISYNAKTGTRRWISRLPEAAASDAAFISVAGKEKVIAASQQRWGLWMFRDSE